MGELTPEEFEIKKKEIMGYMRQEIYEMYKMWKKRLIRIKKKTNSIKNSRKILGLFCVSCVQLHIRIIMNV